MNPIEARVRSALEKTGGLKLSPWAALIALYRADREAFYVLACDGVGDAADEAIRKMADLASQVRYIVRSTCQIEPGNSPLEAVLISPTGMTLTLPAQMVPEIKTFLLEVDGKTVSTVRGKDLIGTQIGEAESRFKLGEKSTWESDRQHLQTRLTAKPFVLRVDSKDLKNLESLPAYVRHGLVNCATKVVLAPTVVFEDLNRGDGSPERLRKGLTFCGKPRWTYDNAGQRYPAPQDMVYLVYADKEGYVFDWDWVKEDPGDPGYPIDWRIRFGNPMKLQAETSLELPATVSSSAFDRTKAAFSDRGDCIFCYLCDEPAFAHRYNADLTVFRQIGSETVTGFKVKNVRRICQEDKNINLDCVEGMNMNAAEEPELKVSVVAILMASLKGHRETFDIYRVVIEALFPGREPPKVAVPKKVRNNRSQLTPA